MTVKRVFLLIFIVLLILGGASLAWWYKSGKLQQRIVREAAERLLPVSQEEWEQVGQAAGFSQPRTYLVLFLNNTELRPAGGFLGTYAAVRLDKGRLRLLKVEGTEVLDGRSPRDFPSLPPPPIKKYLGVERWGFRDSNWSPDFPTAARVGLDLYRKERGPVGSEIDGVIGVTPTAVEELLKLTGSLTVDGVELNSSNFTERLEYEVEYGYRERGLPLQKRKEIVAHLGSALVARVQSDLRRQWAQYTMLASRLLAEKQLILYAVNPQEQKLLVDRGWAGETKAGSGDYVRWVDANLGSLKTDHAILRELNYSLAPETDGGFIAVAAMRYRHTGRIDWRTTKYRTYARVYAPVGAQLISGFVVSGSDKRAVKAADIDQGVELGQQWFGLFTEVLPGQTVEVQFAYTLPVAVGSEIAAGNYSLRVQKQLGVVAPKLTLELDFGKPVTFAKPPEVKKWHGDTWYDFSTDLRVDREFEIKLGN